MIIPPTECFYVVHTEGDAAECVAASFSEGSMSDIKQVVLVSEDFDSDIQATVSLDNTVEHVKRSMGPRDLTEKSTFNPLYIPSSLEAIESVFDNDVKLEGYKFTGLDGNPFTLKTVSLEDGQDGLLFGKVVCRPFDLPPYSEVISAHVNAKLN